MDDEGPERKQKQKKNSTNCFNGSDVFESNGVCRIIQDNDELNRFLLVYHLVFLPCISFAIWTLFLAIG